MTTDDTKPRAFPADGGDDADDRRFDACSSANTRVRRQHFPITAIARACFKVQAELGSRRGFEGDQGHSRLIGSKDSRLVLV